MSLEDETLTLALTYEELGYLKYALALRNHIDDFDRPDGKGMEKESQINYPIYENIKQKLEHLEEKFNSTLPF